MTKKAGWPDCRAKIEHLNLWKRYTKYTYSESTLEGQFKTLTLTPELIKFKDSRSHRMVSSASGGKIEGKFTGQFLQNGKTKTNALNTLGITTWDTHHLKKWAQSVHSSRSNSNYKVRYQMTNKAWWPDFRAKFDHLNSVKCYGKYIWGYSPLTEDSKTLTFIPQISCFVVPKFGSSRIAQNFDLIQIWTLITFRIGRFGKPIKHCKQEGFSANKMRPLPFDFVQYFRRY